MKIQDWIEEARGRIKSGYYSVAGNHAEHCEDSLYTLDLLEKALVIVEDYDRVRELVGETDYKIMSEYLSAFDEAAKETK